ncbi:MAG: peptidoglycan DD-metalloendopeptidase family protein, partial [Christensenellales bacterium]
RVRSGRSKLTFSERLLRNTAIACALLLSILAVRNIDQPWSNAAVGGIESALTMRIDFDQSLGKLNFVRSIMPESSFVFFNISGMAPAQPVAGEVKHAFSEGQPWTMYRCDESAEVRAAMAGTVRAVVQLGSGDFCVLIDHGEGVETMYGYLDLPLVAQGATVARAESLGALRGDTLYYEMRVDGVSVDPEGAAH